MALPDFTPEEKVISGWHINGWLAILLVVAANVTGVLFHI